MKGKRTSSFLGRKRSNNPSPSEGETQQFGSNDPMNMTSMDQNESQTQSSTQNPFQTHPRSQTQAQSENVTGTQSMTSSTTPGMMSQTGSGMNSQMSTGYSSTPLVNPAIGRSSEDIVGMRGTGTGKDVLPDSAKIPETCPMSNVTNIPIRNTEALERNMLYDEFGHPIPDTTNSLRAGRYGPLLMSDVHYFRKMTRFNRERIPPRNVHALGAGAHGYLEITKDMSHICKADFLAGVGKKTPIFVRFSLVKADHGDPDVMRDVRGFAIKHYTQEGIFDMVANSLPVFFVRDPIQFPDFIHTQKRCPLDGLYHKEFAFDFWSLTPESIHMVLMLYSPRGTPATFRNINGFGAHTFRMENKDGESFFVKFQYVCENGIKNNTMKDVMRISATNPDYCKEDLLNHLKSGKTASWKACLQIMPEKDAATYKWDINDVTKVWPHSDYPLIEYGKLVLTHPANNEFKETEQVAFCPANMVPGIFPSNDPMLHGRMMAYDDTQRHRLGPLFHQIPINRPINPVNHYSANGPLVITDNNSKSAYYYPNSLGGPKVDPSYMEYSYPVEGMVGRHPFTLSSDDFVQPRKLLLETMSRKDRKLTRDNFAADLSLVQNRDIVIRFLKVLSMVDLDFAALVGKQIKNPVTRREIENYASPFEFAQKYRYVEGYVPRVAPQIHEKSTVQQILQQPEQKTNIGQTVKPTSSTQNPPLRGVNEKNMPSVSQSARNELNMPTVGNTV